MATARHRTLTTPGGWQAAVRHDTVVSRRRRRHATAVSSDFFCVPFGGRANGRVSTPPTPSATTAAPAPSAQTASTAPTAPTAARDSRLLHPSAPRRATGLPTPIATAAAPARSSARPQADGMWTDQSSYVVRWQCVCVLYITSLRTKVLKEELHTTETTNGGGVAGGSDRMKASIGRRSTRANRCGTCDTALSQSRHESRARVMVT